MLATHPTRAAERRLRAAMVRDVCCRDDVWGGAMMVCGGGAALWEVWCVVGCVCADGCVVLCSRVRRTHAVWVSIMG